MIYDTMWYITEIGTKYLGALHVKQVVSKDALYSTGHWTQYSAVTYMGKTSEKEWLYVYVKPESLCCTSETNTTLKIDYTPI